MIPVRFGEYEIMSNVLGAGGGVTDRVFWTDGLEMLPSNGAVRQMMWLAFSATLVWMAAAAALMSATGSVSY
jgi:hypothetical protein